MTPDQALGIRIWPTILIACAVAAVPFMYAGFHFSSPALVGTSLIGAVSCRVLMRYRETHKLGRVIDALFQMVFVSLFGVMTSYAAATANAPLIDAILLRADQAIGYDWLTYLRVLGGSQLFRWVLHVSYVSCFIQPMLLALVLMLSDRQVEYEKFILSMLASLALVALIFIVCPATTAWHYLGQEALASSAFPGIPVSGENWMVALPEIRAGGGRLISDPLGLIAFPSFHCVMALLNIRAAWSSKWLRIPFIVLNGLMIASTPAVGGHYMVDLIAGAFVTVAGAILGSKVHRFVRDIRFPATRFQNAEPVSLLGKK